MGCVTVVSSFRSNHPRQNYCGPRHSLQRWGARDIARHGATRIFRSPNARSGDLTENSSPYLRIVVVNCEEVTGHLIRHLYDVVAAALSTRLSPSTARSSQGAIALRKQEPDVLAGRKKRQSSRV